MEAQTMIDVTELAKGDPSRFRVNVKAGDSQSRHEVTVKAADQTRYFGAAGGIRGMEATFRFLLDHEPQDQILRVFDLALVPRYFPDFGTAIAGYIDPPKPG